MLVSVGDVSSNVSLSLVDCLCVVSSCLMCVHRLRLTSALTAGSTRCSRVRSCVNRAPTLTHRCGSSVATSSHATRCRNWRVDPSGRRCCHTLTTPQHCNRSTCPRLCLCLSPICFRVCPPIHCYVWYATLIALGALTLLVGRQEEHPACKT